MPERLRFAVASCQDYTKGYFNAYDHIARADVDYILHVGDFIYESVLGPRTLPDRRIELPSGQPIATSLDDFAPSIARTAPTPCSSVRSSVTR